MDSKHSKCRKVFFIQNVIENQTLTAQRCICASLYELSFFLPKMFCTGQGVLGQITISKGVLYIIEKRFRTTDQVDIIDFNFH